MRWIYRDQNSRIIFPPTMNNIHHPMGFILLDLFCPEETQQNKLHPRSFRSSRMVSVWWFWWIIILLFCFPQNQKNQNKPFPFVGCELLFPLGFVLLAFYSAVLFSMVPEETEETAHGVSVLLVVVCSCLRILFCCSDSHGSRTIRTIFVRVGVCSTTSRKK